MNNRIRFLLMP